MANINKISMNLIWGVSGDITAPGPEKMNKGWEVEVVPRQWLNYLQNRLDTNVAYLLQKGLPEWDSETEYQANTSYVQRNGVVYKASRTNTNSKPGTTAGNTNWNRAFQEWSPALESLTSLTPTAWRFPFYNASGQATLGGITSYTVGLMGLSSDVAWRAELKAQTSASQLTWLSNLAPVAGAIPYFNTATSMANLATTPFGRNWIGVADAATGRSQLQLGNASTMTATAINQASTVVARDSTGTAAIGTVIGSLTGNASTATRLQTGRNINGVLFDGTQDITLPPLTADYAGIVARLHINGANMSGTDKTTQLALRNKSNTDWISLAVIEDNILQFAFRNTSNPIVQIGGEVILHTGNQFSLGPTLSDARSRLGLDRVSQGSSDTVVFASTLNNGPYLTVQPSSVGGFNGGTQTWMFRFDETGTLTHGTVPVARVSGLANSAQIPAVTTAQSNSLVQRDSSGSFSAVGINAPNKPAARANLEITDTATLPVGDVMRKSQNLAGLTNVPQARANLGLGTMATADSGDFLTSANNLGDVRDAQAARNNLGLKGCATLDALGLPNGATGLDFQSEQSSSASGWAALPNGLILQWGQGPALYDDRSTIVRLPRQARILNVSVTVMGTFNASIGPGAYMTDQWSNTQFRVSCNWGNWAYPFCWFAITTIYGM
ncbi:tail fiber protein [Pseudomonas phage vB_PaeM_PS24]|uniref:Tail fiber protein n=1 Tax=Pseudomonas phage vB_PaeM_PS24 TaxID=1542092 RepID=A0A0K0L9G2_9CAUD|nr:tail fiber protein [Pseudomonas phage vB_PaeM_PS24]AIW01779.1 hypothetical protein vB_PaeM_PS2400077 [Pseudomonas phage vB_PaeM_PS24]